VFDKLLSIAVIVAVGYWYWQGPYQEKYHPSYQTQLQENAMNMTRCMHAADYRAGATGSASGDSSEVCAAKFNVYQHEGEWHSYDEKRPNR